MPSEPDDDVLVTGAAGFLGRRLIEALLAEPDGLPHISRIVAADVTRCPIDDRRIAHRQGTMAEVDFVHSIAEPDIDVVYHLAAVLSGQSEAEFDTGMQVNVDATRTLLEACRRPAPPSAGGVREHRRRVRRRAARDRIRGRRREAAVVLRQRRRP